MSQTGLLHNTCKPLYQFFFSDIYPPENLFCIKNFTMDTAVLNNFKLSVILSSKYNVI